jgi:signal transduction histidine kinase
VHNCRRRRYCRTRDEAEAAYRKTKQDSFIVTGSSPDFLLAAEQRQRDALAALCHELRTPLGAIIGFAEVLTTPEMQLDEATRQEFLRDILAAARRLQATIERAQSSDGA